MLFGTLNDMKRVHPQTTFHPSRALLPFSAVFLFLSVYVVLRILPDAPMVLFLVLLPYLFFILWWFLALLRITLRLRVTCTAEGIQIHQPASGFFDIETTEISWDEIRDIAFEYSDEFSPASFTGRSGKLTIETTEGKKIVVEHIMTIENYTRVFEIMQQHVPFVYQLPREQLMSTRMRQMIVISLSLIFLIIFLLFISTS